MADLGAFSELFDDPEKLSQIMSLAKNFLGDGAPSNQPPQTNNMNTNTQSQGFNNSDFTNTGFGNEFGVAKTSRGGLNYDATSDLMSKAIPFISKITSSSGNINSDKTNLLSAVSPFVTNDVSVQFEHAVKLISMAKMIKTVMGEFNIGFGTKNDSGGV